MENHLIYGGYYFNLLCFIQFAKLTIVQEINKFFRSIYAMVILSVYFFAEFRFSLGHGKPGGFNVRYTSRSFNRTRR